VLTDADSDIKQEENRKEKTFTFNWTGPTLCFEKALPTVTVDNEGGELNYMCWEKLEKAIWFRVWEKGSTKKNI